MGKGLKLVGLVVGVTIVNVMLFSPGLLGVKVVGGSPFETALAASFLTASVFALSFGVHTIFFKPFKAKPLRELETQEDYVTALSNYKESRVLGKDIAFILEQAERLQQKKETLVNVLNQRFEPTELSHRKFTTVVFEVEKLHHLNIRNILNKISIFDEADYARIMKGNTARFSPQILQEKTKIYNEFIEFVKKAININEEIILNMDKLLLEISRLDNFDNIESMSAMKEIDALINQTKHYKH